MVLVKRGLALREAETRLRDLAIAEGFQPMTMGQARRALMTLQAGCPALIGAGVSSRSQ